VKVTFPVAVRVVAESLTVWKLAFDRHRPEGMDELFSRDALFQGLSPTLLTGRKEIYAYYEALPPGITATFQIMQARQLAQHLVCGFAAVHFTYPDGTIVPVQLSLVLRREGQTWFIAQHHASTLSRGKQPGAAALAAMMNPFAAGED
jgi:hypothetical protein